MARTVEIPDPGDLLARLPRPDLATAWVHRGDGLVGWGEVARITLPAGPDRFAAGEKWMRALLDTADIADPIDLPGSGPVAFGSFTFDPASEGSVLVVPRRLLGRRGGRAWFTAIGDGREPLVRRPSSGRPLTDRPLSGRPLSGRPLSPVNPEIAPTEVRWQDGSLTAPQWERAVAIAVARIRAGDLGKVVLARDQVATAAQPIDARVLLRRLASRYPSCYTFACAGLVGATPELLIRRDGEQISSLVLAGTTPRGSTPADDAAIGAAMLASAKDVEEHEFAVASVRDALAPLCARLDVPTRPSLLALANVQHLATTVTGRLAGDRSALSVAAALHPTAAVCGTPADAAMELIRELEGMDRGRYAGPVGWVDGRGNGDWGIALRCAELDGPRARLFAGCGIVAGSDPAAELAEAQPKFRPMQYAIEG
ncbi:MAG TPA: isochorismate synthase [Streptosporangiaceae bacterium]|nr:isochorismate synthase [Streptosporangiaceae bacterium]